MQRIIELWNETPDFTFLQKLGIGLMCLVFGIAFYAINWYLAKETIAEYGYPKWSGKRKRRLFKTYSFSDKLFLYSHWKHAKTVEAICICAGSCSCSAWPAGSLP